MKKRILNTSAIGIRQTFTLQHTLRAVSSNDRRMMMIWLNSLSQSGEQGRITYTPKKLYENHISKMVIYNSINFSLRLFHAPNYKK